jgi:hypothetical protein
MFLPNLELKILVNFINLEDLVDLSNLIKPKDLRKNT